MGPRPAARPAGCGDRALRPDERRARVRLADRREARRARHRAARAHRGTPVRDLDRRVDRGDLRHVVLARARVRHRPGARGRRPRAPRRGCGGCAAGAALAPGRRPRRRGGRRAPRGRRAGPGHDRQRAGRLGRAQLVTPLSRARGADAPQARPGRGRPRRGRLHGPRGARHAVSPPARRRGRHVALPPLRQLVPERDVPETAVRHALLVQRLPAARARLQPEREEDPRHRARRRGRAETALARLPRRRGDDGRARPGGRRRRVPVVPPAAQPAAPRRGRRRAAVPATNRRAVRRDHGRRLLFGRRSLPHDHSRVRAADARPADARRRGRDERDRRAHRRQLRDHTRAVEDLRGRFPDRRAPSRLRGPRRPLTRATSATSSSSAPSEPPRRPRALPSPGRRHAPHGRRRRPTCGRPRAAAGSRTS